MSRRRLLPLEKPQWTGRTKGNAARRGGCGEANNCGGVWPKQATYARAYSSQSQTQLWQTAHSIQKRKNLKTVGCSYCMQTMWLAMYGRLRSQRLPLTFVRDLLDVDSPLQRKTCWMYEVRHPVTSFTG